MSHRRTSAFTLVEVITVVVIIAIAGVLLVPRALNWERRRAEETVRRVADVLSAAAHRHQFSTQRLAVDFDAESRRLRVLAWRTSDPVSFDAGSAGWVEDPLSTAADLEGVAITSVRSGTADLRETQFRIELPPGEPRPSLVLGLESDGAAWTVSLPPGSLRAVVSGGPAAAPDVRIDLDEAGLRDEAW